MKKGKIMSMIVPIIFVIIPQIIVIIASSFMKNDQSIILNIGGSIGIYMWITCINFNLSK